MPMLAPVPTRYAREAMVSSPDHVATSAGVAILRAGGSAIDAAIAANAVLAVTWPQHCGPGGDLFALVLERGELEPAVLNASGRAGWGADPERLRAEGWADMPRRGDVRAATVPGCVDGWVALHERFGRLELADVLEPARRLAGNGFPAGGKLVEAVRSAAGGNGPLVGGARGPLPGGAGGPLPGGGDGSLLGGAGGPLPGGAGGPLPAELAGLARPGDVVRRPGLARMLAAIATEGRWGFYEGEFGEGLLALGDREFAATDLAARGADWVAPLGLRAWGRQLWTVPPNSQGYLALAGAWIAEGLELTEPGDGRWVHALIEAARAARADRDVVLHEGADGRALLSPDRLAAQRAAVDPRRAADPVALRGDGGTVGLCAVDADGTGVALIQSNFGPFGTGLFVHGVALHNRGAGFALREGHPAEYGPRRRPPHTLSPLLVARPDGSLHTAIATMGGQAQPQILLQLLARRLKAGQDPGDVLAAGRFRIDGAGVAIEAHAPADWFESLPPRGHRMRRRPSWSDEFGHAHLIAVEHDHLAGAADPRTLSGSASGY